MTDVFAIALVLLVALVLYALGGGADFGGGVWDLLASGRTAERQRTLISHAIGPIWEANHVWLVLVVVLLFVGFPAVYAAISVALHLPLLLMLIGIVLRGSAFTFRAYGGGTREEGALWGRVFAWSSLLTPIALGVSVGAVFAGRVGLSPPTAASGWFTAWWAPFPLAVGVFALALCMLLAATYLTLEAGEPEVREAFRRRALAAAVATGLLAWACLGLAHVGAPTAAHGLMHRPGAAGFQAGVAALAIGGIVALQRRAFGSARAFVVAQVAAVVGGWAWAQYPWALPGVLRLDEAAAPSSVLRPLAIALAVGAGVLFPSLALLFAVFKGRTSGPPDEH